MVERTYTIGEVASMVGVAGKNSSTLRLWTDMFADCLSPATRPEKGQPRLYTQNDVQTLITIRDLRRQHVPYDQIRSGLSPSPQPAAEVESSQEAVVASPDVERPSPVVRVDELQEILAPLFEVAEAIRPLIQEASAARFSMEIARCAAAVRALEDRLAGLQSEIQSLSAERRSTPNAASPPGETGLDEGNRDPSWSASSGPGSTAGWVARSGGGQEAPLTSPAALAWRTTPASATSFAGVVSDSTANLNEYGLRPVPARFASLALGSVFLCQRCGSATRPLGITPTSRVVLSCIVCGQRAVVPVGRVDEALGVSGGSFWSRLRGLLTKPFSRRWPFTRT